MDKKYIIQDHDKKNWCFFISNNHRIAYRYEQNGEWSSLYTVDSQMAKDFSAAVDPSGKIHLLVYTYTRHLIYYQWDGSQWLYNILEQIKSRFQNVTYLSITSSKQYVNIIYYVESSLYKNTETLVHYYGNGIEWKKGQIWRFASENLVVPQYTFVDLKDDIHLLYKFQRGKEVSLYYSKFEVKSLNWSNPIIIHTNIAGYNDTCLFVDKMQNIHVLWKEEADGTHIIRYLSSNENSSPIQWTESILNKEDLEIIMPTFYFDDRLYCFWKNERSLYFKSSIDYGYSWTKPQTVLINEPESLEFCYLSTQNYEWLPPVIGIWGTYYPSINIIPMGLSPRSFDAINSNNTMDTENETYEQVEKFKSILDENRKQIENMYSTIYSLQEQLMQKDKLLYSLQTAVKKHDFEIQQLHSLDRNREVQYMNDPYTDNTDENTNNSDSNNIDENNDNNNLDIPSNTI